MFPGLLIAKDTATWARPSHGQLKTPSFPTLCSPYTPGHSPALRQPPGKHAQLPSVVTYGRAISCLRQVVLDEVEASFLELLRVVEMCLAGLVGESQGLGPKLQANSQES